jgi:hypothetical protein
MAATPVGIRLLDDNARGERREREDGGRRDRDAMVFAVIMARA